LTVAKTRRRARECGPEPTPLVGRYRFSRLACAANRCRFRILIAEGEGEMTRDFYGDLAQTVK